MAFICGIKLLSKAKKAELWALKPIERGRKIENMLGHNLPNNFPVIDKFKKGVATSIKSLDLNAKSYQNVKRLNSTVKRYIDKVADFKGRSWGGVSIREKDIKNKTLDLVVPPTKNKAQQKTLAELVDYGKTKGVKVNIIIQP